MTPEILLTHGFILDEDEKERQIMAPYPPLGLLYLAAFLKRQGLAVEVHDPTFSTRSRIEGRLRELPPAVLGLYVTFMTRGSALRIAAAGADLGWTVVVGGPDAAFNAEQYLDHDVDVVVVGEGEETLHELLEVLADRGPHRLHGVAGTVFRDETGSVVRNPPRELIAEIDSLPWPAREMIDLPAYVEAWRRHHGHGMVSLITARGCAYRCDWCSHAVFGRSHRRRSPEDCADEVEMLLATYEPDRLWYADDVFTVHHGWLQRFAGLLADRGLTTPFEAGTRADRFLDAEVAETLVSAGCRRLWIGAESGSDRLLEAMRRDVTADQVVRACELARRHGIEVGLFLMWGYGDERFSDIEATVEMVRRARPDVFLTTMAYPIGGTGYWRKVRKDIVNPTPWAQTSDRENRVRDRPLREHFRIADGWLRAVVEEVNSSGRVGVTNTSEAADLASEVAVARTRVLALWREFGLEP